VLNGLNSRSTSQAGGMVLGLITVDTTTSLDNINSAGPNLAQQITFVGSLTASSTTLTVNSTTSPNTMIPVGSTIYYYDANTSSVVSRLISAQTGAYTYTLNTANGTTANSNIPILTNFSQNISYSALKSTSLQSITGIDIEVPKGMKPLEVQLQNNNYGVAGSGLLPSTTDWGLMLLFEFYDPEEEKR
jgi:hypothetical protein